MAELLTGRTLFAGTDRILFIWEYSMYRAVETLTPHLHNKSNRLNTHWHCWESTDWFVFLSTLVETDLQCFSASPLQHDAAWGIIYFKNVTPIVPLLLLTCHIPSVVVFPLACCNFSYTVSMHRLSAPLPVFLRAYQSVMSVLLSPCQCFQTNGWACKLCPTRLSAASLFLSAYISNTLFSVLSCRLFSSVTSYVWNTKEI